MSATYVAIIMDGNGRWAQQHGVPIAEGHKAGADTVKARLRDAVDLGVRELTLYSFSTENWSRPQDEVDALMALFSARIIDETPELHEEGVQDALRRPPRGRAARSCSSRWSGRRPRPPSNTRITLFVAFNYGGRVGDPRRRRAVHAAAARRRSGKLLYAPEMHDPDLLIRTQRRAADLQLPAVAGGVLASCTSPTCCGRTSRARTSRRRSPATRRACAASGGARWAGRGARARAAQEGASDLLPRILVAIPAIAFAVVIIWQGGWVFAAGIGALARGLRARADRDVRARAARCGWRR